MSDDGEAFITVMLLATVSVLFLAAGLRAAFTNDGFDTVSFLFFAWIFAWVARSIEVFGSW